MSRSITETGVQAIVDSQLITHSIAVHGLFYTEQDRLKKDLLSFIQGEAVDQPLWEISKVEPIP